MNFLIDSFVHEGGFCQCCANFFLRNSYHDESNCSDQVMGLPVKSFDGIVVAEYDIPLNRFVSLVTSCLLRLRLRISTRILSTYAR